ncbi:hypothetical protein [Zeaxanthinibacter enoshimensis]|uniref:hypothetical protein n=1 Tax=Zeaxanthinibacter enoshimensis TaxID=392009 RepID=UPI001AAD2E7B|nr:hypothetical protein [Zeaxanthinibacter enoshimensis]
MTKETKVTLDRKDRSDQLDPRVNKESKVRLDQQDPKVRRVQKGKPGIPGCRDPVGQKVTRVM